MAVASLSPQRIQLEAPEQIKIESSPSNSKLISDSASESSLSSSVAASSATATPDHYDHSISSPNLRRDVEIQSPDVSKSEEYRLLFHLPPEEVLVEDFNCAFQENILIQGHMYLFVHFICFYSNIFGFETKKIIPFQEVTSVRRAKTAGIFPNAIEICAGGRKYFFASFLSRDEAFKIINEGWSQHANSVKDITEQQDMACEPNSQQNSIVATEIVKSTIEPDDISHSTEISTDVPPSDFGLKSSTRDESMLKAALEHQVIVTKVTEPLSNIETSRVIWTWKEENTDAPKIPKHYTSVAESKFQIKVEDFFKYFFSDDAVNFVDSFHKKCGDRDFKCTSWHPHEPFGYTREVSFQHPIKIYLGAKCGGCQEVQKFRVYRNSHLVIETSQEINDVPYGDYFRVEGLWDVERYQDESTEFCILHVYVNVAFSKKTIWKGKIVQSTVEECREAYAIWMDLAHEFLKQKHLEKLEDCRTVTTMAEDSEVHLKREVETGETSETSPESRNISRAQYESNSIDDNQWRGNFLQENLTDSTSLASILRELMAKLRLTWKSQSHLSLLLVIIFVMIFLMQQLSILVLLARPQHIHVSTPVDYMSGMGNVHGGSSNEAVAWMEKRIHHLKDEMYVVETRLERMRYEHALLKKQLKELNKGK